MAAPARFPARRVQAVRIAALRCDCGAVPVIFAVDQAQPVVHPFCSPACAARAGLRPWAEAGPADRARWPA